jgi:hypothetical protein
MRGSCKYQQILDYGSYIIVICDKFTDGYTCEHQKECVNDDYIKFCRYPLENSFLQPGLYPRLKKIHVINNRENNQICADWIEDNI